MRHPALLVALILLTGGAATLVALHSREANSQFVSQQEALVAVGPMQLEQLILTTNDPRPGYSGRARAVRCSSQAHTVLGNPWTCLVRYPRLPHVRYRVIVYANRSIFGSGQSEGGAGSKGSAKNGSSPGSGGSPGNSGSVGNGGSAETGVLTVRGCCVAGES